MKTVAQIAEIFGVTSAGVSYWIDKGLPYEMEKVVGIKRRKIIDPEKVITFLGLSESEANKYRQREGGQK